MSLLNICQEMRCQHFAHALHQKCTTVAGVHEVRVEVLLNVILHNRGQMLVRQRVVVSGAVRPPLRPTVWLLYSPSQV